MSEETRHTTINGYSIPIENIDYVGPMERPYEWGYYIHTKYGNKIWVNGNDSHFRISDDRNKLIEKINNGKETNT